MSSNDPYGGGYPGTGAPLPGTDQSSSDSSGGFNWQKWLPLILGGAGVGSQLLGGKLASGQVDKANQLAQTNSDRLWGLANQQQQTQSGLRNLFLPAVLQNMGYKGQIPQQFQMSQGNPIQGAPGANSSTGNTLPNTPPTSQPSSLAGGLGLGAGLAGAGTGIAGAAGLLGSTGTLASMGGLAAGLGSAIPFVGPALAVGALLANKIGQGRRAANSFVQGVENPFGQELAQIVKEKDAGNLTQARQDFQNDYGNYMNQANQWKAAGGKQALVANQSLQNKSLQDTINTLKSQLGLG